MYFSLVKCNSYNTGKNRSKNNNNLCSEVIYGLLFTINHKLNDITKIFMEAGYVTNLHKLVFSAVILTAEQLIILVQLVQLLVQHCSGTRLA